MQIQNIKQKQKNKDGEEFSSIKIKNILHWKNNWIIGFPKYSLGKWLEKKVVYMGWIKTKKITKFNLFV